jgi:hypothetical protein
VKISVILSVLLMMFFLVGCPNEIPAAELDPILTQTDLTIMPLGLFNVAVSSNAKNTSGPLNYKWSGIPVGVTVETKTQNQYGAQFVFSALEDVLSVAAQPIQLIVSSGNLTKTLGLKLTVEGKPFFKIVGEFSSLSLRGGEQLNIPITIQRANTFSEPVQIEARDLPADVEANSIVIDPNSTTGTLVLSASPNALSLSMLNFKLFAISKSITLSKAISFSLIGTPFFQLTVLPSNWQFSSGTQKDFSVSIRRYNGFSDAVELHLDGLPLGFLSDPVSIPVGISEATVTVRTSLATTHRPNGIDVALIASSGNLKQSALMHLSNYNLLGTAQFGLTAPVPEVAAPGEHVRLTAQIAYDLTQSGVNVTLLDGRTGLPIEVQNLTMTVRDFAWQEATYTVDIGFDAPRPQGEGHDYLIHAKSPVLDKAVSVYFGVHSKVNQILTWVNQPIIVHPSCLVAIGGKLAPTCGTTANIFEPEAYLKLGAIPFVDSRTIALPAFAVPRTGYENGFDSSVIWEVVPQGGVPAIGSVTKIDGIWYYTAPYNTDFSQTGFGTESLKVSSAEDQQVFRTIQIAVAMYRVVEDSNFSWPTSSIQDAGSVQLRVYSNRNIASVPYHLNWAVTDPNSLKSDVGADGSLSQSGCLQSPKLATGTYRDITVVASVSEIPGLELRRTIRVEQGTPPYYGECGTFVDGNGWVKY